MSNITKAELDNEIATFRSMQGTIQKLKTDEQQLLGQQSENEMVKQVRSSYILFNLCVMPY